MSSVLQADKDQSSYRYVAPKLSSRGLSILLSAMCLIPVITIALLWWTLPPVKLNSLQADVQIKNAAPGSYYKLPFDQRIWLPETQVVVTNTGSVPWTNWYVRVNHDYSVFENGSEFLPGETRGYLLNRFSSRTGAFFDMRYRPVTDVMIYARLPDHSRATFFQRFDDEN